MSPPLPERLRALLPNATRPPTQRLVSLRADGPDGTTHYPIPGAGSPWVDLAGVRNDRTLRTSWHRPRAVARRRHGRFPLPLQYNGLDNVSTIPAEASPNFRPQGRHRRDVVPHRAQRRSSDYHYLIEWLQGFGSTLGQAVAVALASSRSFRARPTGPRWRRCPTHLVSRRVAKERGSAVYLNGDRITRQTGPAHRRTRPEVVLAAPRGGPGIYGTSSTGDRPGRDWPGALAIPGLAVYQTDRALLRLLHAERHRGGLTAR